MAQYFVAFDPQLLAGSKGIRRLWQALQLVQLMGIPVASLTSCTAIASLAPPAGTPPPNVLAANIRNAVQARYTPATWRSIAQSIFDPLRRRKRDALVTYLVNELALENPEQLFEYFLVDPGMEPVVQTSRLRLALSSVQTFIQRCLLNLENGNTNHPERNVAPNAIEADWWQWMKRYRVWQANREIFLFPENWMEPELRLDKSDLFQAMESTLLQGDVTRDLVEDAFLTYLKGLEVRARLDIVALYAEQDVTHPGLNTLHVIGRTYGKPHKYFYRKYAGQAWSAWEVVTPAIDGDHIVPVVWRGRLNLFWLTFLTKSKPNPTEDASGNTTGVGNRSLADLSSTLTGAAPQLQVQVQLNWSNYYQGKWSDRISTDLTRYPPIDVQSDFDPHSVYVHVSRELDQENNEGAVRIHLEFPGYTVWGSLGDQPTVGLLGRPSRGIRHFVRPRYAFRVTSKNCEPDFGSQYAEAPPPMPYNTSGIDATLHTGSGSLQATYLSQIVSTGATTAETEPILQTAHNYALLTAADAVVPPFLDPSEPAYQDAGGLVSPFFFKDTSDGATTNELTFFVQPSLTETTLIEWEGWAIPPRRPDPIWLNPRLLDQINVIAQVPVVGQGPVITADPGLSIFPRQSLVDWATHPSTVIAYGTSWIGQGGRTEIGTGAGTVRGLGLPPGGRPALSAFGPASRLGTLGSFTLVGSQGLAAGQLRRLGAPETMGNGKKA
jgi:hypothetical protein